MFYICNGISVYSKYNEQPWVISDTMFITEQCKSYNIDRDSIKAQFWGMRLEFSGYTSQSVP